MYKYTLAFIISGDKILMLNRNKTPWMGSWNGLGGKLHENESPLDCVHREVFEETGLVLDKDKFIYKGTVTWNVFNANGNGLYMYIYYLDQAIDYQVPKATDEGILDFKSINWICSFDNEGVAKNIPHFLPTVLNEKKNYQFECIFEDKVLKDVIKREDMPCQKY